MGGVQPAAAKEGDGSVTATEGDATSESAAVEGSQSVKTADKSSDGRVLMGVIRVGSFAKHLMLDGELLAELVVMCAEKPTTTTLRRIASLMANEMLVSTLMYLPQWSSDH